MIYIASSNRQEAHDHASRGGLASHQYRVLATAHAVEGRIFKPGDTIIELNMKPSLAEAIRQKRSAS